MNGIVANKGMEGGSNAPESLSLRDRLLLLHQIGNDLAITGSMDELCRQAVLRGRQLLECQRIGIWFRKNDSMLMMGSFGVDEDGKIRDERAQTLTISRRSPMGQVISNKHSLLIEHDCPLRNHKGEAVGQGVHVIAALWNGTRVIGCLCIDNLLKQQPFVEADFDILGMYAAIIGDLGFGISMEDRL